MKKNGFAPLLILIIIAVLGLAGYFAHKNYNKNSAPTSENWITYENKNAGFTAGYPAEFKPTQSLEIGTSSFESTSGDNLGFLEFKVGELSKYKSQIEMIKEDIDGKDPSVSHRQINGRDVYLESQQLSGNIFERNIFIINGNSTIHIRVSADEDKTSNVVTKVENLADEIISTFKFTK